MPILSDQDFLGTSPPVSTDGTAPPPQVGGAPIPAPAAQPAPLDDATFMALPNPSAPATPDPGLAGGAARNLATGESQVLPTILGMPAALEHAKNYIASKALNLIPGVNTTPEDLDKYSLTSQLFPSSNDVSNAEYGAVNAAGGALGAQPTAPYQPTTGAGKFGQAAVTAAGVAALDPMADLSMGAQAWNLLKQGIAGGVGERVQSTLDPSNPIIGPLAALLTHTGLSTTAKGVAAANENITRPFYAPTQAGQDAAGRVLPAAAGDGPALANPSQGDLAGAAGNVQAATDAIGPGLSTSAAMTGMQDSLVGQQKTLQDARTAAVSPLGQAFRAEPLTPPENLPPAVAQAPAFPPAVSSAANDMLNGSHTENNPYGAPMVTYPGFNPAGDVAMMPGGLTPDLLGRTATKLGAQAADARASSADTGAASGLSAVSSNLSDFLRSAYPNTYPALTDTYQAMSRPLDVYSQPRVARAIDQTTNGIGQPTGYSQEPTALLDSVAASKDPGTVMSQFIQAAGGDKAAITGPIQDAIVGRLRDNGVIDPLTGEVNAKALAQDTRKYLPTISAYLPELQQKFGTATAAQTTLDNMRVQQGLATDLANGGARDTGDANGVVTGGSLKTWLNNNQAAIEQSQGSGAFMRAQKIQQAIGSVPGNAADAVASEVLPGAVSDIFGGSENAILSMMAGQKLAGAITAPLLNKFRGAYSQAIEQSMTDPVFAKTIMDAAAKRPGQMGKRAILSAIGQIAGRGLQAAAVTSGLPATQQ